MIEAQDHLVSDLELYGFQRPRAFANGHYLGGAGGLKPGRRQHLALLTHRRIGINDRSNTPEPEICLGCLQLAMGRRCHAEQQWRQESRVVSHFDGGVTQDWKLEYERLLNLFKCNRAVPRF